MDEPTPRTRPQAPDAGAVRRLDRRLFQARLALAWEDLWRALWPLTALFGVFLVVALLDVLPLLDAPLHAGMLALFALAALGVGVVALRALRWPDAARASRRLETESGLAHRPLTALKDRQAAGAGDPASAALWLAYRKRVAARLGALRAGWPRPHLAARDPLALRALIVLMVVSAAALGPGDAGERLRRALTPGAVVAAALPGQLDIWITPPAYTGIAPLVPRPDAVGALSIPTGSALLAQVAGGAGLPSLVVDERATPFEAIDARSFRVGATLDAGRLLRIEQNGKPLAVWRIEIVPDAPPVAAFAEAPGPTRRGALKLDFEASDDYGLASAAALVRRADPPAGMETATLELPLTLPEPNARSARGAGFHDLTAHPWAGLKARVRIKVVDSAGQAGESEEAEIVLPERQFRHPIARAIVEQRKILVGDPAGQRRGVAVALNAIAGLPAQYQDDTVVFLALRLAALRIDGRDGAEPATVETVQALLWDTALRIEDGRLSLAERELRALQQRLQDAIANRESDEEIERLIRELQQAIDRYLQAMIENAMRNPQDPRAQRRMDRNAQRIDRNDLQRMLDQARQMARTGARDQARDMLQRLQEMLENLRAGQPMMAQPGGEGEGEDGEGGDGEGEGDGAGQMMQGLQDMMRRQQQLTDRSFRRSQQQRPGQRGQQRGQPGQGQPGQGQPGQQGQPGGEPGDGDAEGDIAEQDALRRRLGDMMRSLSERTGRIPDSFARAERAMREAIDAMQRGQAGRAVRPQMDALDQMRQGAREMLQQLNEQASRQQGGERGNGETQGDPDARAQDRDPAGRPMNNGLGGTNSSDVNIPAQGDLQRSREILDELLRRAGERFRPQLERDYIDRLLRRF